MLALLTVFLVIFSYVCDKRRKSIIVFLKINCWKNTKGIVTLTFKVTCRYHLASAIIKDILILVSLFTQFLVYFSDPEHTVSLKGMFKLRFAL